MVSLSETDNNLSSSGKDGIKDGAGVVLGYSEGVGLAMLRLSSVTQAEGGSVKLIVFSGDTGVEITPFRPPWWSDAWGKEEMQI